MVSNGSVHEPAACPVSSELGARTERALAVTGSPVTAIGFVGEPTMSRGQAFDEMRHETRAAVSRVLSAATGVKRCRRRDKAYSGNS